MKIWINLSISGLDEIRHKVDHQFPTRQVLLDVKLQPHFSHTGAYWIVMLLVLPDKQNLQDCKQSEYRSPYGGTKLCAVR